MNWQDGPGMVAAIVAVLALLGSFISFVKSLRAERTSVDAGKRAERAEEHANEARSRAAAALERANELAVAASHRDEEDWFVEWRAEWTPQPSTLKLTNWGKDDARSPSLTVTSSEAIHHVQTFERNVAPMEHIAVELPEIGLRRYSYVDLSDTSTRDLRDMQAAGIFSAPESFFTELKVVIRWRSGEGRIQEQVLAERVA